MAEGQLTITRVLSKPEGLAFEGYLGALFSIRFFSISDANDFNHEAVIKNIIHNAVITYPDAVRVFRASEFYYPHQDAD